MTQPPVPRLPPDAIGTVKEWADKVGGGIKKAIDEAIDFVHMGLGSPVDVSIARDAWNVTAVRHVATATNGVTNAMPDLEARWTGPAFTAFKSYHGTVVGASGKVQKALADMGAALTKAGDEVVNTYVAVIELVGVASRTIANFVGSVVGSVQVDLASLAGGVAKAIVDALVACADGYNKAVQAAVKNLAGYRTAANQAAAAIAQLGQDLMPSLPTAAGDRSAYVPVKAT